LWVICGERVSLACVERQRIIRVVSADERYRLSSANAVAPYSYHAKQRPPFGVVENAADDNNVHRQFGIST
jgi:hypothetical protein